MLLLLGLGLLGLLLLGLLSGNGAVNTGAAGAAAVHTVVAVAVHTVVAVAATRTTSDAAAILLPPATASVTDARDEVGDASCRGIMFRNKR
jgi:hypothetical protein